MRIAPAESDTVTAESEKPEPAAQLRARHSLSKGEVGLLPKAIKLAARNGWEVEIAIGTKRYTQEEWPFTAYTYVSKSKNGHGRSGSSLYRLPARRFPEAE